MAVSTRKPKLGGLKLLFVCSGKVRFFAIKGISLNRNMPLGSAKSLSSYSSPDCNSDRNEAE